MRAPCRCLAVLALLLLAAPRPSFAEADTFGLGDGRDGSVTNLSGTINRVAPITQSITAGTTTTFTIGTAAGPGSGFGNTDLVMLWQPTGLVPEPTPSVSPVSVGDKVGRWEFARLTSGGTTSLTLAAPTLHSYDANYAQVIRVPQYTTVTVTGAVNATTWDGLKGGIVVFLANGAVTINNSVDAAGDGFRGGTKADNGAATTCPADFGPNNDGYAKKGEGIFWGDYNGTPTDHFNGMGAIANAGGGGNCVGGGGGGGGHGGQGGTGGKTVGGVGGAQLDDLPPDLLVMGGGGGAGEGDNTESGNGGAGGGVIFIRALSMASNGSGLLRVNGSNGGNSSGGHNAGAGGGGAGGTVVLRTQQGAAVAIEANGGNGGATDPAFGCGGGGAGGRIYVQATGGSRTATVTLGAPGATTWGCAPASTAATAGVSTVDVSPFCSTDAPCAALPTTPNCLVGAGKCVECAENADCLDPVEPTCDATSHTCRACVTDGDCGALKCLAPQCVACKTNADCTDPAKPTCSATNTCVPCDLDTDCTTPLVCQTLGALDGRCTQCKADNVTHCTPSTAPACSASTGSCTTCTADYGVASDAPCPDSALPVCTGGLCYQCATANPTAWCTNAAAPACRTTDMTCVACNGDNGAPSTTAPCPTATAPACTSGRCYPCSPGNTTQCTPATPACRTTDGTCVACNGDNGAATTAPCPDPDAAWCVSGACLQCTSGHVVDSCDSAQPACSVSTGLCAECTVNYGTAGDAPCPEATAPVCLADGTCLQCTSTDLTYCKTQPDRPACLADNTCGCASDADCRAGGNTARLCNTTDHFCYDGCRVTADCSSGYHCEPGDGSAGSCVVNPGVDAGQPDVGQPDVGQPDVGQPDVGQPDVGTPDTGTPPPDAGAPDTGTSPDVGVADTGIVEPPDAELAADATLVADAAALADGAIAVDSGAVLPPDATVAKVDGSVVVPKDAGDLVPTYDLGGCGCGSVPGSSLAPWALFALALFAGGGRRSRR